MLFSCYSDDFVVLPSVEVEVGS